MVLIVYRKARASKGQPTKASKQKRPQAAQVNVTESNVVTPRGKERPSDRYAKLRPWLMLSDMRDDRRSLKERTIAENPSPELRDLARRDNEQCDELRSLRTGVCMVLSAVADAAHGLPPDIEKARVAKGLPPAPRGPLNFFLTTENLPKGFPFLVGDTQSGRINLQLGGPFGAFVDALNGAAAERIRHCPVCPNIFYARRLSQKACSQRCNATRRVRAWRANQAKYEQTRKEKPETMKSESKTRGTKPRKEHRR